MNSDIPLCAVIIAYNPGDSIFDLTKALIEQNCEVVIVDNGSLEPAVKFVNQCEVLGAVVLRLGKNFGVGRALNVGCRFWMNQNYQWIFTFDQDSTIEHDFVTRMRNVILINNSDSNIALFAPVIKDAATNTIMQHAGPAKFVITSGSCVNGTALRSVGYFNEKLFIDYVDFEICVKFRRKMYGLFVTQNVEIIHSIGKMEEFKIPYTKLNFMTTNHAPLRRYYKHRNYIYMVRSYVGTEAIWLSKQGLSLLLEPLKIVIAERDKRAKLRMIVRGWRDGMTAKLGEYSGR